MRIAITDDRADDMAAAESFLRKYIAEHYPETMDSLIIETFSSAEELMDRFQPGVFDLLMLDIYMKQMSGMEAAEAIRKKDSQVSIVFQTSSEEHILAGYRVFAAGYFLKPLAYHEEEFAKTFDFLFPHLLKRNKNLAVTIKGESLDVPYRSIYHIDINDRHQLCLHMKDTTLVTHSGYDECYTQLITDGRFMECHHRILVNMDYIRSMGKEAFILQNGTEIPISQRKRKEAKIAYVNYLAHKV